MKKITILAAILCISCLTGCRNAETENTNQGQETLEENIAEVADTTDAGNMDKIEETDLQADNIMESEPFNVSLDVTEHYTTHKGDMSNLYHIDEDNVLWGCGNNEYGQLGQGTQDYDFHEDMVKIAENVIHVDYSQRGFVIFLTKDHKLYGMGNAGCGALQQYSVADWSKYANDELCYISEPRLLMVNVEYACCGRDDIVSLQEDGSVWTWGTIYYGYFVAYPKKIMESAVWITGGWYNHAALLPNGTVWTWGYNGAGNCGVADRGLVSSPTMVAEDVVMVWTDLAVDDYHSYRYQSDAEELALAWTGRLKPAEHDSITEYDSIRYLNNTVIQKADGSYWVCGENVGTEEKVVPGEEADYPAICTHEFYPCIGEADFSFADISDRTFYFSSGVGAWWTELHIHSDGSFQGIYLDADMGDTEDAYPNGTEYYCEFSGVFGDLEKVDAYTYKMKLVSMEYARETGEEEIIDGVRYIYSGAYGLVGGEEFHLYLPGIKPDDLPESYRGWIDSYYLESAAETGLPFYGLYNINTGDGFSSHVYEDIDGAFGE